ncbi:MAG: amidohydrolase family protein [Sphingobacteriaceae bacterium]|nr:amidohydrolase family protein [Sphingobacteriaceae bacterium]
MRKITPLLLASCLLLGNLATTFAQTSVPSPGKPQAKPIWITGATLHLGNGQTLQGIIGFENGLITYVGTGAEIRLNAETATIIDASGKHVYPGFIAFNSILGLNEIDAVRATRDQSETGGLNPNVRALVAYNTDSRITPTVRNSGTLLSQVSPQAGNISGRSSVVQHDAWNWEDAVVRADDAMYFNWPSFRVYDAWWAPPAEEQRKQSADNLAELKQFMEDAKAYLAQKKPAKINLKLEAMRGVFEGKTKVFVRANEAKAMVSAVQFFAAYQLKPVLVGAEEAADILPFLQENKIDLVLSRTQRLPNRSGDAVDAPYRLPAQLAEAGIRFGFSMDGAWEQRNLPFQAGQAVGYGLSVERAVQALSSDAAAILGIEQRYGELGVGKSACLFISTGDALDVRGNQLEAAFIDGRAVDLGDKQKALYKKFSDKYGVEQP